MFHLRGKFSFEDHIYPKEITCVKNLSHLVVMEGKNM